MRRTVWVVFDDHGGDTDTTGLPAPDVVVVADSGLGLAAGLGLDVDVVVGDLDSVTEPDLATALRRGVEVQRHDPDKDATDLALALRVAVERSDSDDLVVVVGGSGGRLDHALANVAALTDPVLFERRVRARLGGADLHVVRGLVEFAWPVGATVTLLPYGGPARGVTTTGLQFALDDEDLPVGTTRGVSNVVQFAAQTVHVRDGCVVAVLPRPDQG